MRLWLGGSPSARGAAWLGQPHSFNMLTLTELDREGGLQRHVHVLCLGGVWWVRWVLKTGCPILGDNGSQRGEPRGYGGTGKDPFIFLEGMVFGDLNSFLCKAGKHELCS